MLVGRLIELKLKQSSRHISRLQRSLFTQFREGSLLFGKNMLTGANLVYMQG